MHAIDLRRLLNRNAVLLSVYALANDEGSVCRVTNKRIAEATGRSPTTVAGCLGELEARGDIQVFDWRDGLSNRQIILMDHPQAERYVRHIAEVYARHRPRRERRRAKEA